MNGHHPFGGESGPAFGARTDVAGEVALVALQGELDMATAPVLERRLSQLQQNGIRTIVLDLRELFFLDSSGVHVVVKARDRAVGGARKLMVIGVRPSARRVFAITDPGFSLDDSSAADTLAQFAANRAPGRSQLPAAGSVVDA